MLCGNDELLFVKLLPGRNGDHTEAAPLLGSMSVDASEAVANVTLVHQCRQLDKAMELPPYGASFVSPGMFAGAAVYNVTFSKPLPPAISTSRSVQGTELN